MSSSNVLDPSVPPARRPGEGWYQFADNVAGEGTAARRAWRLSYVRRAVVFDALCAALAGVLGWLFWFPGQASRLIHIPPSDHRLRASRVGAGDGGRPDLRAAVPLGRRGGVPPGRGHRHRAARGRGNRLVGLPHAPGPGFRGRRAALDHAAHPAAALRAPSLALAATSTGAATSRRPSSSDIAEVWLPSTNNCSVRPTRGTASSGAVSH
jgi:hypothetical protein